VNRYYQNGGNSLGTDDAGNLTMDWELYNYYYDYENRLIEITYGSGPAVDIAEFAYDARGRRIEKYDAEADETVRYYHNNNWQVLTETDESNNTLRWYVYGNYIDEPLMMHVEDVDQSYRGDYYYVQDALYNVRALVSESGFRLEEQTTYDAYGMPFNWCSGDADGDGDVVLPTRNKDSQTNKTVRLRCVTSPDDAQKVLLNRLGLRLPQRLRRIDKITQM